MARWHLPAILLLSAAYQSLFIWNGLSPLDEGWPLYAAMRLQAGGTLYRDVYWVFPPGALLPAWVGYALHLLGQRQPRHDLYKQQPYPHQQQYLLVNSTRFK